MIITASEANLNYFHQLFSFFNKVVAEISPNKLKNDEKNIENHGNL